MDSVDKAKIMLYKALKLHPDHMAARQMLGSLFLKKKKMIVHIHIQKQHLSRCQM